jgi:Putative adhesin
VKSRSVAIIALTAITASGCGVGVHFADYRHTATVADATVAGPVTNLQVNADDGHVVVRRGSGEGVTVHRVVHYESGTPHPGQHLTDGTLTFDNGCSRCRVDYDLTVPASVRVRARTDGGRIDIAGVAGADTGSDSGSVTVRHVSGDVSARSDSGGLTLQDVEGTLSATTDSGAIHGTELRSAASTVSSDSGGVRLAFTRAPANVRATTDSGSIRLALPGGPYNVHVRTDSGGHDVNVPTASTASAEVSLQSDSGGLHVDPA